MADFWAGYISGAAGIIVGSPLDIIKVRSQSQLSGSGASASFNSWYDRPSSLLRGAAAPLLGYGALNALLFVSYNRSLELMGEDPNYPISLWKIWVGGAVGGLGCWVFSTPTELVKCRAQVTSRRSWDIARELWGSYGVRGLYLGGVVTGVRDSLGFGFYFWAYEYAKYLTASTPSLDPGSTGVTTGPRNTPLSILLCGGIAGCISWASIYPLDVIKTQVQVQSIQVPPSSPSSPSPPPPPPPSSSSRPLLQQREGGGGRGSGTVPTFCRGVGAWDFAKEGFGEGGVKVFFNGIWACLARAFVVNAVTFFTYEWCMDQFTGRVQGNGGVGRYGSLMHAAGTGERL